MSRPRKVLIVDDQPSNVAIVQKLLATEGYEVLTAESGEAALRIMAETPADLVLLDVVMPGLGGLEVCRRLKSEPSTRLVPVVMLTALRAREDRIDGINAGADDFLFKPFDADELRARVRSLVRLKRYTDELDSAEAVIMSLALTIEARDPYTEGHCLRLARYAATLGRRLGLGADDLHALERGGYLHDLGKIGVPDPILLKPGLLTTAERDVVKRHTIVGDHLCGELRSLQGVRPIVRSHHERLDGSGYPEGLRGSEIPLLAQIMGVVDVYDALTTTRPYRSPVSSEAALAELEHEAERGWRDRDLVTEFCLLAREGLLERSLEVVRTDGLVLET